MEVVIYVVPSISHNNASVLPNSGVLAPCFSVADAGSKVSLTSCFPSDVESSSGTSQASSGASTGCSLLH